MPFFAAFVFLRMQNQERFTNLPCFVHMREIRCLRRLLPFYLKLPVGRNLAREKVEEAIEELGPISTATK